MPAVESDILQLMPKTVRSKVKMASLTLSNIVVSSMSLVLCRLPRGRLQHVYAAPGLHLKELRAIYGDRSPPTASCIRMSREVTLSDSCVTDSKSSRYRSSLYNYPRHGLDFASAMTI